MARSNPKNDAILKAMGKTYVKPSLEIQSMAIDMEPPMPRTGNPALDLIVKEIGMLCAHMDAIDKWLDMKFPQPNDEEAKKETGKP